MAQPLLLYQAQALLEHLRSGGAPGADETFERGCDSVNGPKEIYLPWKNFNYNESTLYPASDDAKKIAQELYPAWNFVKEPVRLLMSRNVHQVLGKDLNTPSTFLICYTPDGCTSFEQYGKKTGGTGLAIALASIRNIPIFNLRLPTHFDDCVDYLSKLNLIG